MTIVTTVWVIVANDNDSDDSNERDDNNDNDNALVDEWLGIEHLTAVPQWQRAADQLGASAITSQQ